MLYNFSIYIYVFQTAETQLQCLRLFLCPQNGIRGHLVFVLSVTVPLWQKKTVTLVVTFDSFEVGLSYFTCTFLVRRP